MPTSLWGEIIGSICICFSLLIVAFPISVFTNLWKHEYSTNTKENNDVAGLDRFGQRASTLPAAAGTISNSNINKNGLSSSSRRRMSLRRGSSLSTHIEENLKKILVDDDDDDDEDDDDTTVRVSKKKLLQIVTAVQHLKNAETNLSILIEELVEK